ncbi:hypothetical protein KUTeg_002112, partial [Tegillarca granosa]
MLKWRLPWTCERFCFLFRALLTNMVRVLKCHHFKSQNVVPVDGEPVSVYACQKWVFVATENFLVEVFQVHERESKYFKLSSFNTEANVHQILFNPTGNYIVTVECKTSRKQEFYSVRVYLNWQYATKQTSKRLFVRPAGSDHGVRASSVNSEQLQIIDIPCKIKVNSIATCSQTGNVAIATGEVTKIYHLVEKTVANTDKTYHDVVLFLELHWGFFIEKICISEEYISVLSEGQVQVVRVLYSDKQDNLSDFSGPRQINSENLRSLYRRSSSSVINRGSSSASLRSNQSSTSETASSGNDKTLKAGSRSSATASPALSNSSLSKSTVNDSSNFIQDDEHFVYWNFEDFGEPENYTSNRKQIAGGVHSTMGDVHIINLLYKRRPLSDSEWKFMCLVPLFGTQYIPSSTPLHSASHSGLIGMCCLFSCGTEGYLYDVWSQAQKLSTYKYTSEAIQIVLDSDLLHIITKTGLETYTARCTAGAIHNTEVFDNIHKTFPPADLEICLCGVHPFMGARDITLTDKHVILLSKMDDSSRPDCENWRLALPYYIMSGMNVAEVVRQVVQYKQHTKKTTPYCFGKGFLHYLNHVLFMDDEPFNLKEDEGDLVLEVCNEAIPHKLSSVILLSRIQSFNADFNIGFSKKKKKCFYFYSALDLLAMAVLHLKLCEPDSAQVALNSIDQKELTEVCASNHQLLHQDFQQLSPLSQLMRCHCPDVLIKSLTRLHDSGTISLDLSIKLLQGPSGHGEMHKNLHIKEYLELLVNASHRRYIFEDAIPKGDGHFAKRPNWLNFVPPFSGPDSIKSPCQYTVTGPSVGRRSSPVVTKQKLKDVCPCFLCNEDLLKLQSLLCYKDIQVSVVEKVLHLIEGKNQEIEGYDSLWMLCQLQKEREIAIEFMMDRYPTVVIEFGLTEEKTETALKQELLEAILSAVRKQAKVQDEREPVYMETLRELLKQLAYSMNPETFLNILPDDGSFSYFLPYISICYENQQSKTLLNKLEEFVFVKFIFKCLCYEKTILKHEMYFK